jgi:hypothetical protein
MTSATSFFARRTWWTALVGLVALAAWVVAFGVGWRAWILAGSKAGIVAHVDAAGVAAGPWMILAALLTLTAVVMAVGIAVVRHLVDGPVESVPELPSLEEHKALPVASSAASSGDEAE